MLEKYLQVKKLIALTLTAVFAYLAVKGEISSSEFMNIFTIVIAFYFGQSTARQSFTDTHSTRLSSGFNGTNGSNGTNITGSNTSCNGNNCINANDVSANTNTEE